jgi:hypothetical protein
VLHHTILSEVLDAELAVAVERLGGRISDLRRSGATIICQLNSGTTLRFDGGRYDAEPYAVSVVNGSGEVLRGEQWPGNLNHGEHPVLGRPFICIRGTYEYHAHPSHLADQWDRYRGRMALVDLLEHILRRAGT